MSDRDFETELTAKKLKQLTNDGEQPPLGVFLFFESLEWLAVILVLFLVASFTKPIWGPVWDFFSSLLA